MRLTELSKDAIYGLLQDGEIIGFLVGSRRYLTGDSVRDYIARRAAEPLTIRRNPNPRAAPPAVPSRNGPRTGPQPERQPERCPSRRG
jgi:hypothetical protein